MADATRWQRAVKPRTHGLGVDDDQHGDDRRADRQHVDRGGGVLAAEAGGNGVGRARGVLAEHRQVVGRAGVVGERPPCDVGVGRAPAAVGPAEGGIDVAAGDGHDGAVLAAQRGRGAVGDGRQRRLDAVGRDGGDRADGGQDLELVGQALGGGDVDDQQPRLLGQRPGMIGVGAGEGLVGGAEDDDPVAPAGDDDGARAVVGADDPGRGPAGHHQRRVVAQRGADVRLLGRVDLDVPGPARAAAEAAQVRVQVAGDAPEDEHVGGAEIGGQLAERVGLRLLGGVARRVGREPPAGRCCPGSSSSAWATRGSNCVPGVGPQLGQRRVVVHRGAVAAVRRHRVPRVAGEDDPAGQRDQLAGEAVGVAAAVPALVLVADRRGD